MAPAIEFDHVTKTFRGGVTALDAVTWSIPEGAHACLLGPNGAGKSTSIRILEGALNPSLGTARLLGVRPADPAYLEARRRTGIVPQRPGMYHDLTAGEWLELARRLYGLPDAGPMVVDLGLEAYLDRRMDKLSGGFQSRLVLAVALACDPALLLLDEPTAGLDPVATRQVHDFLRTQSSGRTTLLCTHDLEEAEQLCDTAVIMRAGKVVVAGPIERLRRGVGARLALAARQGAGPLLAALAERGLTASQVDGVVEVAVGDPAAEAPELLRDLLGAGLDVYRCEPLEASLTDVFFAAVETGAPAAVE